MTNKTLYTLLLLGPIAYASEPKSPATPATPLSPDTVLVKSMSSMSIKSEKAASTSSTPVLTSSSSAAQATSPSSATTAPAKSTIELYEPIYYGVRCGAADCAIKWLDGYEVVTAKSEGAQKFLDATLPQVAQDPLLGAQLAKKLKAKNVSFMNTKSRVNFASSLNSGRDKEFTDLEKIRAAHLAQLAQTNDTHATTVKEIEAAYTTALTKLTETHQAKKATISKAHDDLVAQQQKAYTAQATEYQTRIYQLALAKKAILQEGDSGYESDPEKYGIYKFEKTFEQRLSKKAESKAQAEQVEGQKDEKKESDKK